MDLIDDYATLNPYQYVALQLVIYKIHDVFLILTYHYSIIYNVVLIIKMHNNVLNIILILNLIYHNYLILKILVKLYLQTLIHVIHLMLNQLILQNRVVFD